MAFNTYAEGLKIASDLAQRAVLAESSLSSLPPLASPIPTLQKAFPLYISAAEHYSHLLSSKLVPEPDRAGVKRKWRLVLERAEKVKTRIEELGGQVGKVGVGDDGEEEAIRRRGGRINGLDLEAWREPSEKDFELGKDGPFRSRYQPDLPSASTGLEVEWAELPDTAWAIKMEEGERWVITQGVGADCSVVAGLGACLEHDRRWGTSLAHRNMAPHSPTFPRQSDSGKHVLKLLLNGEWRSTIVDSLLPQARDTRKPLHSTSYPLTRRDSESAQAAHDTGSIGPAWIPLVLKAYFLAHGGYSLRGSNPAPDIYALTGWIPERLSFGGGFQREKDWTRLHSAWKKGQTLVTLGTGKDAGNSLIPLHAYTVLDVREKGSDRILEIFDPGLPAPVSQTWLVEDLDALQISGTESPRRRTGLFTMSWDEVCSEFEAVNLNWDPSLYAVTAKKHWSWAKPESTGSTAANARYTLKVTGAREGAEVVVLLSQHIVNKDRALDDIALHITDEHAAKRSATQQLNVESPYSNAQHIMSRHILRSDSTSLLVIPVRDRGLSRTDFTLQAFSTAGTDITLQRISTSLPFSQSVNESLTFRSAGGHARWPSYSSNPQYRVSLGGLAGQGAERGAIEARGGKAEVRLQVNGDSELPWNVKLLWSDGGLVYDVSEDAVVADTGSYSYGMAFTQATAASGIYTAIVSSFEPMSTGQYTLTIESSVPVSLTPLPSEGAGLFHRSIEAAWTVETAGGRPSQNNYHLNPHLDLLVPSPLTLQCRLHHPELGQSMPLNLTLFRRKEGGGIGEQIATSGPYSDAVSGVRIARTKPGVVQSGVYVLVPSGYERGEGKGKKWKVDVWADRPFSLEAIR